jgi:hypothetical protein
VVFLKVAGLRNTDIRLVEIGLSACAQVSVGEVVVGYHPDGPMQVVHNCSKLVK